MKHFYSSFSKAFFFLTVVSLVACTTQLAPRYDKALFDGITQVNAKIMELFATVSAGTTPETFSQREATYNALIGQVDALALQSKARPIPENTITERVNTYLESRGVGALLDGEAPSAAALNVISKNLTRMRDKDKTDGLRPGAISAFRNAVVISMDQALTYEAFLER